MTRRLVLFLTFCLLWSGPVLTGSAWGQSAAAIVQQIHDVAYSKCMTDAKFGSGAELQGNCSCSADVVMNLLSDDFKHAIADGTHASFTGAKLKGDELERNVTLLKTCPKIGVYLQQQCTATPDNAHCAVLQRALEQAQ
jgi:hypothetical protein